MTITWPKVARMTRTIAISFAILAVIFIILVNTVPVISEFALDRQSSCVLKNSLGVPCLGCRGTRSAFAFMFGRVDIAFVFNPFAACLGISLLTWSFFVAISGRTPDFTIGKLGAWVGWGLFALGLLGNWAYVIVKGG